MFFYFERGNAVLSLESIIEEGSIFHHYQRIYDIQEWNIIGHEGLLRTDKGLSPEVIFKEAREKGKLYELELLSIHKASKTYKDTGYSQQFRKLFLNVYPSTLSNVKFQTFVKEIMNENGIISQQLVFEINENEAVNYEKLIPAIAFFKDLGIEIAIDDFGQGSSSTRSIIELSPNYIKLDRYFLDGIKTCEQKQDVILNLNNYCQKYNIHIIAEGLENDISLSMLKYLGIRFAQGYLLGRPSLLDS